ncbi:vacuolar protein sorting-associated protein 51 [Diplodia corticola]|uniref:Vacuolar protein sorting-associated protein 51 homolog n=1 Tax=Diplodia corticola TaxID=236234 RepID=A0A1J9S8K8_9PEZI|nr:vacuolar protein sorting-associated protein 51 [Diplodia corticola]OJD35917.1 vacuolar protein sorting-associated protein 51 [Diplodia corticola]
MSTIASPRPSSSIRSPSSTRTSLEVPTSSSLARSSSKSRGARNRDRSALRDYYNLKSPALGGPTSHPAGADGLGIDSVKEEDAVEASELDREGFNAEEFVRRTLEREGLEGVLRVESGLVGQIKGLDGERKALVYDNYSKLIAATDTIRKMRTNMDPLTPATSTLSPAISHIAETATALSASIAQHALPKSRSSSPASVVDGGGKKKKVDEKEKQRQTVRWVLDAPRRLRVKVDAGEVEEAAKEWEEIRGLLEKWNGVQGVDEVKMACEEAMVASRVDSTEASSGEEEKRE